MGAGLLGKNQSIFGSGRDLCSHTFVSMPLLPCSVGIFVADLRKQRLLPQAPRTLLEEPTDTDLPGKEYWDLCYKTSFSEISGSGVNATSGPWGGDVVAQTDSERSP